ncbi:MAG: ATP-binding cassette domain-containing protein [Actinomycetota bacterium]|nr:ATP-binding cassette domain-containing protein [Actinomycetota bacterium]
MIEARGLTKSYRTRAGTVEAVNGVDIDVDAGEIVGFLGPNGAGKTTTQRMLTTLLSPTAGTATVAGHDLRKDPVQVRRCIGYVPQGGSTSPEATVGEELVDHGRLCGLSKADSKRRGRQLISEIELDGTWERQTRTLSGGQRRRLDIALGLINEPPLLFMDEPTAGLDPQARANLWRHIRALRDDRGVTVFLTTHYLEEADALCDNILVIDHGVIVARGTPGELKRAVSGDAVSLRLRDADEVGTALAVLAATAHATVARSDGDVVDFNVPDASLALPELFAAFEQAGVGLAGIEVHRPTLDDVFLSLTGRALRDDPLPTTV